MSSLSEEKTEELYERIEGLEKEVKTGKSDVEKAVAETKRLYRDVRKVEGQVHRVERLMRIFGLAAPTLAIPGIGPATAIMMMAFQIATLVARQITLKEIEKDKAERRREQIELWRQLVAETKAEIEADRREQYRGTVPG